MIDDGINNLRSCEIAKLLMEWNEEKMMENIFLLKNDTFIMHNFVNLFMRQTTTKWIIKISPSTALHEIDWNLRVNTPWLLPLLLSFFSRFSYLFFSPVSCQNFRKNWKHNHDLISWKWSNGWWKLQVLDKVRRRKKWLRKLIIETRRAKKKRKWKFNRLREN